MQELDLSVSALLDDLADRLGLLLPRSETRDRALRYLQGLISQCERKNSWHLAEWLGDATPEGGQYLLDSARWNAEAARDVLCQWVMDRLGSADGVLVVDETGFIKKGQHSAGCNASTVAPPVVCGSFASTPVRQGMPSWIVLCTCPSTGLLDTGS